MRLAKGLYGARLTAAASGSRTGIFVILQPKLALDRGRVHHRPHHRGFASGDITPRCPGPVCPCQYTAKADFHPTTTTTTIDHEFANAVGADDDGNDPFAGEIGVGPGS